MKTLEKVLSEIKVGFPQAMRNVTMFPLESNHTSDLDILDFKESVDRKTVRVTELDEKGSVDTVLVKNKNKQPVFILDGEHLLGAKQERTSNLSVLIPPKSVTEIPVSCVEAGRWSDSREGFYSEGKLHFSRGRRGRHKSVSESLTRSQVRSSDQREVWDAIAAKEAAMKSYSRTHAMGEFYESNKEILSLISQGIRQVPNQVGCLFCINNRMIGFDIFPTTQMLTKHLRKLTESIAIDAIELSSNLKGFEKVSRNLTKDYLTSFFSLGEATYPAIGLGKDIRGFNEQLTASALIWNKETIHASGFTLDSSERGSSYRRRQQEMIYQKIS